MEIGYSIYQAISNKIFKEIKRSIGRLPLLCIDIKMKQNRQIWTPVNQSVYGLNNSVSNECSLDCFLNRGIKHGNR
jgi:hypothetical protein